MKILFLSRSLDIAGAERQLTLLAKGLHECGHDVKVAVFYTGGLLETDLKVANIPLIQLNKKRRWHTFSFLWRLAKIIRCERPDILHSYLSMPNILAIMFKPFFLRLKIVWGVRSSNMYLDRYEWLMRMSYRIERMLSGFPNLIICNSHAGLEYAVRHGFPREKMVRVPNGIDTNRFYPNGEERARIRGEWGIQEDEWLIGLVARLDPMKGYETFLRASARLAQQRSDIRFVCVGDGPEPYKSRLTSLSNELGLFGRLIWAGARKDMASVYNSLDIAVSSSYGEGFPNVIAESMACGIPCVVTDIGDSSLIVGETAIVVPPENPVALAEGIMTMLSKTEFLDNTLKSACRIRIVENFSTERLIKETTALFNGLLCSE